MKARIKVRKNIVRHEAAEVEVALRLEAERRLPLHRVAEDLWLGLRANFYYAYNALVDLGSTRS